MPNVDEAIRILNEINTADPRVLPQLMSYRVACNKTLGEHPTVQVGVREAYPILDKRSGKVLRMVDPAVGDQPFEVGLLGIINGIFGIDERGWGHIYAHMKPDGYMIDHFSPRVEEPDGV